MWMDDTIFSGFQHIIHMILFKKLVSCTGKNHYDPIIYVKHSNMAKMKSKLSKCLGFSRLRSSQANSDTFIIKHAQRNKNKDRTIDSASFDLRRVVFVSLHGLHRTWKECPSVILYSAIFILPLKIRWIYNHSKYSKKICAPSELTLFLNLSDFDDFIELLRWKDGQGLLFSALDDYETTHDIDTHDTLIHPFWSHVSDRLCNLYDSASHKQYAPLKLCCEDWNDGIWNSKYDVSPSDMICELFFKTLNFKRMQELLYQSNSKTLLPVTAYTNDIYHTFTIRSNLYDDIEEHEQADNWVFTANYDPHDIYT
eukprot:224862_1